MDELGEEVEIPTVESGFLTWLADDGGYWLGLQWGLSARTPLCSLPVWLGLPYDMAPGLPG